MCLCKCLDLCTDAISLWIDTLPLTLSLCLCLTIGYLSSPLSLSHIKIYGNLFSLIIDYNKVIWQTSLFHLKRAEHSNYLKVKSIFEKIRPPISLKRMANPQKFPAPAWRRKLRLVSPPKTTWFWPIDTNANTLRGWGRPVANVIKLFTAVSYAFS